MKKLKGFTLVELLIILAVISILFIGYVSKADFATYKAKDAGILTDFRSYELAINAVTREHGEYTSFNSLNDYIQELHKSLDKSMVFEVTEGKYLSRAKNPYGYKYELRFNNVENSIEIYSPKGLSDGSNLFAYGAPDENGEELYGGIVGVYEYSPTEPKNTCVLRIERFSTRLTLQTPETELPVEPEIPQEPDSKYKLATDSDFIGEENGAFKYIGNAEYVEIPHTIKGISLTNYNNMFSEYAGKQLKGIKSTNKNITAIRALFQNYDGGILDLSEFDTSNVTDMYQLFYGSKVEKVDLTGLNTSNVTLMQDLFRDSTAKEITLGNIDTSKVFNMQQMFYNCKATVIDTSGINTENVTMMSNMFRGTLIAYIDLRNFNTSKVTAMSNMFYGASATTIDLSSFDTSKVTDFGSFLGLAKTTTVYARTSTDLSRIRSTLNRPATCIVSVK